MASRQCSSPYQGIECVCFFCRGVAAPRAPCGPACITIRGINGSSCERTAVTVIPIRNHHGAGSNASDGGKDCGEKPPCRRLGVKVRHQILIPVVGSSCRCSQTRQSASRRPIAIHHTGQALARELVRLGGAFSKKVCPLRGCFGFSGGCRTGRPCGSVRQFLGRRYPGPRPRTAAPYREEQERATLAVTPQATAIQ